MTILTNFDVITKILILETRILTIFDLIKRKMNILNNLDIITQILTTFDLFTKFWTLKNKILTL